MNYKQITIYTTTQAIDIISGFLTMHGVRGVMIEDAQDFTDFLSDTTIHWDYVDEELMRLKTVETNVTFYLADNLQGIEMFRAIEKELPSQRELNPAVDLGSLRIVTSEVDEEDWSTAWKKYYHPTKIGKKLIVVPCWEEYECAPDEVRVVLDPGMAFGTGTHETTRLCMQLLEQTVTKDTRVLDVGTGSGILAITALLLGAKEAVGVDIDEVAVRTAHENAALNGVDERLTVFCGDLTEKVSGTYDVICANIVADVIIRLSANVTKFMHEKSVLLVSGIIEERCEEVKAALCGAGLTIREIRTDGGWAAIRLSF